MRLVELIRRDGPLTFAAYMQAALFDPDYGFYTRGPKIGQGGHFTTSAEAHPAFADAILNDAIATWEGLGRPADFRVTEAGPGSGLLAYRVHHDLLAAGVPHEFVLIELSAGLRETQRAALGNTMARWVENPAALEPAPGFLYANELLDALPVRLLQWPDEVLVDADAGSRLVETLTPADPELMALLTESLPAPRRGGRYVVRPTQVALVTALAQTLSSGRLVLIDYGGASADVHHGRRPPIRTYIGGQQGGDPLAAPGTQDLTADVDFGALTRSATAIGVKVERCITQTAWLAGHKWSVPPVEERNEADWALAGLLDERLPFVVWVARR